MGLDKRANALDLISTMNGLYFTGGVLGALSLPWVADKYGRKWACGFVCITFHELAGFFTNFDSPPSLPSFQVLY